jgi:hypothetical protein
MVAGWAYLISSIVGTSIQIDERGLLPKSCRLRILLFSHVVRGFADSSIEMRRISEDIENNGNSKENRTKGF